MMSQEEKRSSRLPPPIYIVSGGVGASGDQLVLTILAQYPHQRIPVNVVGSVRSVDQVRDVVSQAETSGGLIVHTLVDERLRNVLIDLTQEKGLTAIDLMGDLMDWLTATLGREPLGQPGLYRKLHRDYFDRIEAIEYTMSHDDGKSPREWHKAEIVLVGVSRTGKTPLSLYLSVLGWKVANVPLVPGVPVSPELFRLDRRRVVGLTIEPGQLLIQRKHRQSRLGAYGFSAYVEPAAVYEEIQNALQCFHEGGFSIVDVTDKTIESGADEIIRLITRKLRRS